jgi:hypothetical protein
MGERGLKEGRRRQMRYRRAAGLVAVCAAMSACGGHDGTAETTTTFLEPVPTTAVVSTSTPEPATTSVSTSTTALVAPTVPPSVSVVSEPIAAIYPPYDYRTSFDGYVYDYIGLSDGIVVAGPSGGQYVVKFACGDHWLSLSGLGEEIDEAAVVQIADAVAATRACKPMLLAPQLCLGLVDDPVACEPGEGIGG